MNDAWKNDKEYQIHTVIAVARSGDGLDVTLDEGFAISVDHHPIRDVQPGDIIRLYGRGLGYPIRGVAVIVGIGADSPYVIQYQTKEELSAQIESQIAASKAERASLDAEERAKPRKLRPDYTLRAGTEAEYEAYTKKNDDAYGACCVRFADRWGALMERALPDAPSIDGFLIDRASKLSHEADTEGITGFMYGCAVRELAHFWIHGDALRRWHNKEYGAPEAKGVVNPAVLTISVPEKNPEKN